MRIAIVTATYPPYLGGTGNVCHHHARQLVKLGHDVDVYTASTDEVGMTTVAGVRIHRLRPLLRVGNGVILPQLLVCLRGFDVIHWHYPFFGGEIVALAARLTRTPLIVTYHQDVILEGFLDKVARLLEGTIGRWALCSAEKVLFTSQDYANHSKMQRILPPAIVDVVPNGVDCTQFSIGRTNNKETTPLTALLIAGLDTAHYFKGVANFLQAMARIDNMEAIIIGDGNLRSYYEQTAQQLGVSDRVQFVGRVHDKKLPLYYQQADVTVLPSTTMGEAFGLVLVESLASGTPVIASNLPGVRTVVTMPEDGLLIAPDDVNVLTDALYAMRDRTPAQRSAMGLAGRQKVERLYAWEHIGRSLEAIYQQIQ